MKQIKISSDDLCATRCPWSIKHNATYFIDKGTNSDLIGQVDIRVGSQTPARKGKIFAGEDSGHILEKSQVSNCRAVHNTWIHGCSQDPNS